MNSNISKTKQIFYTKELLEKLKKKQKLEISDNIIISDNIVFYNGKKRDLEIEKAIPLKDGIYIITLIGKQEVELDKSLFEQIKKELLQEENNIIFFSKDINSFIERLNIKSILDNSISGTIQYYPSSNNSIEYIKFDDLYFVADNINSIGENISNIFKTSQYKIYKVTKKVLEYLEQRILEELQKL